MDIDGAAGVAFEAGVLKACYLDAFAKTGFSPEYQHRSPLGP
jgi:hypothetical protein